MDDIHRRESLLGTCVSLPRGEPAHGHRCQSRSDRLLRQGLPSCNSAANRSPAREAYHKLSRGALEEWREAARSGEAGSGLGVWLCVNPAWFVGLENLWELLNGLGP
jgi:hypothetical protein